MKSHHPSCGQTKWRPLNENYLDMLPLCLLVSPTLFISRSHNFWLVSSSLSECCAVTAALCFCVCVCVWEGVGGLMRIGWTERQKTHRLGDSGFDDFQAQKIVQARWTPWPCKNISASTNCNCRLARVPKVHAGSSVRTSLNSPSVEGSPSKIRLDEKMYTTSTRSHPKWTAGNKIVSSQAKFKSNSPRVPCSMRLLRSRAHLFLWTTQLGFSVSCWQGCLMKVKSECEVG